MELIANQFADIAAEIARIRQEEQATWKTEDSSAPFAKKDDFVELSETLIKLGSKQLARRLREAPLLYTVLRDQIARDFMDHRDTNTDHTRAPMMISFAVEKQRGDWKVIIPPDAETVLRDLGSKAVLPGGAAVYPETSTESGLVKLKMSKATSSGCEEVPAQASVWKFDPQASPVVPAARDDGLLPELISWRNKMAKKQQLPGYMVVKNVVLEKIAAVRPITMCELAQIGGVGAATLQNHGKTILSMVRSHELLARVKAKSPSQTDELAHSDQHSQDAPV